MILAMTMTTPGFAPAAAADLGGRPEAMETPAPAFDLQTELSRYLALLEVRATFDVVDRPTIEDLVAERLTAWRRNAPPQGELDELDRQLLAETSYYLVGLRYLVDVGGAAFPGDKAELVYRGDTLVRLDALERRLVDVIANREDPLPLLVQAEAIRALTEGYAEVPEDLAVFAGHADILDAVWSAARLGTRT